MVEFIFAVLLFVAIIGLLVKTDGFWSSHFGEYSTMVALGFGFFGLPLLAVLVAALLKG